MSVLLVLDHLTYIVDCCITYCCGINSIHTCIESATCFKHDHFKHPHNLLILYNSLYWLISAWKQFLYLHGLRHTLHDLPDVIFAFS